MKTPIAICSTLLLILFVLQSCEPAPEDAFVRHFIIEEGEHYATPRLAETLQSERLIFEAEFDESAIYNLGDEALQSSKNKLFGFADCNSLHHQNSARFAWQWFNDRLEIYAYCYVNSARIEQFIGTVNLNEKNRYEIELTKEAYIFRLNGEQTVQIERAQGLGSIGIYYLLYPYFGGSVSAPHSISIDLSQLR